MTDEVPLFEKTVYLAAACNHPEQVLILQIRAGYIHWTEFVGTLTVLDRWETEAQFRSRKPTYIGKLSKFRTFLSSLTGSHLVHTYIPKSHRRALHGAPAVPVDL